MTRPLLSRRTFLQLTGDAAGGSLVVLSLPAMFSFAEQAKAAQHGAAQHGAAQHEAAQLSAAEFKTLSLAEATELAAIAARIIPTDETPGATEAGAIYFIDHVLGSSRAEVLEPVRQGLAALASDAAAGHNGSLFSALSAEQQDGLLRAIEQTPFFLTLRYLTICGTFSLPEYGGNRGGVGYQLVGMDHQHAWTAPYGYYDADYAEKGE